MPLPYTDEALMIVAMERLRAEVANMPMAIAMNASRKPPSLQPTAFDRPQAVIVMGPNPLPVIDVGGGGSGAGGAKGSAKGVKESSGGNGPPKGSGGIGEKGADLVVGAMKRFVGIFIGLLGPVAAVAAIIGSELSGVRVLTSALNVFASAVAPILLPAMFMLSVALVAASDLIWAKIMPKLEGFYRVVISDLLPAVEHFADVCGKAAQALAWLAKSTGISGGGDSGGGFFGGANRLIDGLTGDSPYKGQSVGQATSNATEDVLRVGGGMFTSSIRDWVKGQVGIDNGQPAGASDEAQQAAKRAQLDTLREMQMMMGSQGGVGSIRGNWASAQNAATNMTPFQAKVLERFQQTISALERAVRNNASGVYTEGDPGRVAGILGLDRVMGGE